MRKPSRKDPRARELAQIHIAQKDLRLDDDTYRAMLWSAARVRSAGDLDAAGRQRVLDHLKARGWRPRRRRGPTPAPNRQALVGKIRAQLSATGRDDAYADGIARRMFDVDRYGWCQPDQLRRIVAALAYDARRRGRQ